MRIETKVVLAEQEHPERPLSEATYWELAQWIAINSDIATMYELMSKEAEDDDSREEYKQIAQEYYDRRNAMVAEVRDREQRAVSPAPAGEDLRERIAKAMYAMFNPPEDGFSTWPGNPGNPIRGECLLAADAVLAVLNGEGER